MIDYSNGYPVQVTTNVTKNTPWKNVFKKNSSIKKIFTDWSNDGWYPSNYENNPHYEDYKNIFIKLRFDGHIHDNSYFEILDRFEKRYSQDKELRNKIDRYLEISNMNYRSIKNGGWRNPLGGLYSCGPKILGLSLCCEYRDTELGKEYKRLEFELKDIFNKI